MKLSRRSFAVAALSTTAMAISAPALVVAMTTTDPAQATDNTSFSPVAAATVPTANANFANEPGQNAAESFADGTHKLGIDIQSGVYKAEGGENCTWERLSAETSSPDAVIETDDNPQVYLPPTDVAFKSEGCGQWTKDPNAEPPAPPPEIEVDESDPNETPPESGIDNTVNNDDPESDEQEVLPDPIPVEPSESTPAPAPAPEPRNPAPAANRNAGNAGNVGTTHTHTRTKTHVSGPNGSIAKERSTGKSTGPGGVGEGTASANAHGRHVHTDTKVNTSPGRSSSSSHSIATG